MRPLVYYPDRLLSMPTQAVDAFDGALRELAQDLAETMRAAPGVGITAPHLGIPKRLAVIQLVPSEPETVYVNPRIVAASADRLRHTEGSVSMPGVTDEVERPARVRVAFQDLDGRACEVEAEGFMAACLQHEIDQLDGIFWLDRLTRLRRDRAVRRSEKLRRR